MKYTIEYCGISESDVKLVKDYYSSIYKDLTVSALPTSGLVGGISRSISNPSVVMIILTENKYSEVKTKAPRLSQAKKIYKYTNSEDLEVYCREQTSLPSKPVPEDEDKDAPELPSSNTELENTPLPSKSVPEDEDKDAPELVPADLSTEEQSSSNTELEDTDVPEITSVDLPTEVNFTEDQPTNIELEDKIKELSDALNLANKENAHLQEELNGRDVVLRNLQKQVQDLEDLGSAETKELEEKNKELEAEITKLNEHAQGVNNELQTKLDSAESKNKALESEITKLNEHIQEVKNDLQTKLDSAESKNKELEETKQNLEADVIELNERLQGVDAELQAKLNSTENNNEELEKVRQNLEEQLNIVQDLNNQITSLTEENTALNSTIEEMNAKEEDLASQITSMYDELASKDKEYEEQCTTNKALQTELDTVKESLDAEKANSTNLENELNTLKINVEKQVASEEEVSELTTKLRDTQQEVQNLIGYKSRCTELEIQLAEQKAKSTPSGVFAGLGKMQALRSVFTTRVFNSISLTTDTICVAAGSSESVTDAYNLIRTSCQATNKRCLILDLSLDSYIDREFGCRGILSPVDWLAGKAPYTNFLAKTSLPNAMIISLGLAYTNDVALLSIDWQSKLNEIKDFADKIIIYVGPLINTVSKILFNSFSNSIQSHVVLKATPINIRTLLLTLTGLTSLNNSMLSIDCVNYTTNSKVMYENLAAKYNSRILGSTEVIQL